MRRHWKRWWRWSMAAAGGLGLASAGAWLLFQHIPDWYRPIEVPPDQIQSVRDDFVAAFDRLSELLNTSPGPFEFRLRQDQINAWLSSREQMWPDARRWLPPLLADPQVILDPGVIRLAATLRRGDLRTVLSARLGVGVNARGIAVRLTGVSAGSLPMPRSSVRRLLARLDGHSWPAGRRVSGQLEDQPLPALAGLYEGIVLPNGWVWQNGRQPFRITDLSVRKGEVTLTIQPLPRQAGGSARSPRRISDDSILRISPGSLPTGRR